VARRVDRGVTRRGIVGRSAAAGRAGIAGGTHDAREAARPDLDSFDGTPGPLNAITMWRA